ncbi:MAG: L-serine ammonia-lyase, iron-sulfur-dependent subunit beta [Bernardetiaceae bacterium]
MPERSSIFDMIGPVMIGPSSSHTAGVVKIANTAIKILNDLPEQAEITFYNSFARTYEGHGSDRAIIGGLLGFKPDDGRIREAFDYAKTAGFVYHFRSVGNASTYHPNSIQIKLRKGEQSRTVLGVSKGGGVIEIQEVDGFRAHFTGQTYTLIFYARDQKGSIAYIAAILANESCNIATMSVSRTGKNKLACLVIEIDSAISELTLNYLRSLNWVQEMIYIAQDLEETDIELPQTKH